MAFAAANEIEAAAIKYAKEATRLDQQGAKGLAITYYQKAIDAFLKLVNLYPNYELNKVYIQRAMMYQERIKVLQVGAAAETPEETFEIKPLGKEGEQRAEGAPPQRKAAYEDLLIVEKPNVRWEDVSGLEETKKALKEAIIYPSKRPDLFPLGFPRGILLYGPPGCGKTLTAAAVATEIDAAFYSVDAASIMSKWLGEAEKNVARLFRSAREAAMNQGAAIIFIDEIDSLLGVRYNEVGGEVRVRNQFLKEMDGILDKGKNWPLYVIGATNKPWALDWAFIRRFQKRIYVPVPDFETRLKIYQLYTQKLVMEGVDLNEVARLSEGYSGSDIRDICQAVQLRVVSELFESGRISDMKARPRPITMDDFRYVISRRKPSITQEMIKAYEVWAENFKAT
ncbi:MAG: AAA family ATPase [Candidatus Methanomethylicia archaeon]|jgi:SpoVK/Ycf46/Vps4 family AAA+-type ATPase|uniref:AAA family ATPase n=1 Tax=Thermoproteota archaeon TaxID=2056631 RepID=A0A523BGU9_9CREN|nr:AAA family ATPase [Candidatus Methanomethylicia archaeon]MCQ5373409.1 AAA family ATPase [Candidatus Methanomethylicia archaeon]NHV60801.1 AAA family ATPase [Candidatus Verstraetearchaeota archaeon]TDA40159.1 MAG: AAA family ATPase [Candidatus Verstraetearchaeota archaeon]